MKRQTPDLFRRRLLGLGAMSVPMIWLAGCGGSASADVRNRPFEPLELTEAQWREILTPEQYRILRRDGTEPAFSSPLDAEKRDGTYLCAGCYLPLFSSDHKYDSGTGWPSFWQPLDEAHVDTKRDFRLILPRTEYHCARCKGHQGHVFDDGPQPTGKRWCNNGLALEFVPDDKTLPELRT